MAMKEVKKRKRAPTIKQKKAIQAIVTGQANTIKDAMLYAGYSPISASANTTMITNSDLYKTVLIDNGITLTSIARRHSELLQSQNEAIAMQAINTGYKVHGLYDKGTSNTYNAPIMIQINPPRQPKDRTTEPHSADSA